MGTALKYTLFAVIATIVNILGQEAFLSVYNDSHAFFFSVLAGTFVGLVTKYVLDKRYIFRFTPSSMMHDTATFMLYTMMGLVTTAIFWSFEFTFEYLFATKTMRYLGAALGLFIGYYVKYRLDKRFVFVARNVR